MANLALIIVIPQERGVTSTRRQLSVLVDDFDYEQIGSPWHRAGGQQKGGGTVVEASRPIIDRPPQGPMDERRSTRTTESPSYRLCSGMQSAETARPTKVK
jgi:hypothetical protein